MNNCSAHCFCFCYFAPFTIRIVFFFCLAVDDFRTACRSRWYAVRFFINDATELQRDESFDVVTGFFSLFICLFITTRDSSAARPTTISSNPEFPPTSALFHRTLLSLLSTCGCVNIQSSRYCMKAKRSETVRPEEKPHEACTATAWLRFPVVCLADAFV